MELNDRQNVFFVNNKETTMTHLKKFSLWLLVLLAMVACQSNEDSETTGGDNSECYDQVIEQFAAILVEYDYFDCAQNSRICEDFAEEYRTAVEIRGENVCETVLECLNNDAWDDERLECFAETYYEDFGICECTSLSDECVYAACIWTGELSYECTCGNPDEGAVTQCTGIAQSHTSPLAWCDLFDPAEHCCE